MRLDTLSRSAAEQAALVRDGRLSARELVDAALAAIERDEHNAFVLTCPERARAEADAIAPGDPRPLAGVPVAIKDLIVLTEGLATTNASRSLGDWAPDVDSAPIARLREAGAIIVGKTNTPEWGMRPVTEPERYGPARNPHDPDLITGGSSGGSAAAVAAGLVPIAHGNDAGGSVRIPASCCGVVGLKPSRFRVPIGPELAAFEGFSVDTVLSRTVLDTALALDVLAGDGPSTPLGPPLPHPPFAEAAMLPPHTLRIRMCTTPPGGEEIEPECVTAAHHVAGLLESLGHEVDEWTPDWQDPGFAEHWMRAGAAMFRALVARFGELSGAPLDPERMEPATRAILAAPHDPESTHAATEGLREYALRILGGWRPGSILLTPTLTLLPRPVGSVGPDLGVRFSTFLRPFNVTGQPAISLPLHHTSDGVPVGVQLAGPVGSEARLLSLAGQLEAAAPWPLTAAARAG
ncbi:MAG TPA: amidase [Solirubrobacteraceae bacterium]|nr:amidase [Solirubrobacteraceae bacterium]